MSANIHMEKARQHLDQLKKNPEEYVWCIRSLRQELEKGGCSITDIGTSEKELQELLVKGCKAIAEQCLFYLRKGTEHPEWFLSSLRTAMTRGGLSLADIGTTEKELASFARVPV